MLVLGYRLPFRWSAHCSSALRLAVTVPAPGLPLTRGLELHRLRTQLGFGRPCPQSPQTCTVVSSLQPGYPTALYSSRPLIPPRSQSFSCTEAPNFRSHPHYSPPRCIKHNILMLGQATLASYHQHASPCSTNCCICRFFRIAHTFPRITSHCLPLPRCLIHLPWWITVLCGGANTQSSPLFRSPTLFQAPCFRHGGCCPLIFLPFNPSAYLALRLPPTHQLHSCSFPVLAFSLRR